MRLDLAAILIFSISGLVMAGLHANQHFLLPALAPLLYNLGQIFGVTVLSPSQSLHVGPLSLPAFGLGLYGMVYGVILGACLHLLIQVPGLIRYQFHWRPAIELRSADIQRVLILLGSARSHHGLHPGIFRGARQLRLPVRHGGRGSPQPGLDDRAGARDHHRLRHGRGHPAVTGDLHRSRADR